MRPELAVEVVEHDVGLDHAAPVLDIEGEDAVQVLGEVDHQPVVDRLAALRGAAAARRDDRPRRGRSPAPQRVVQVRGTTTPSGMIW